MSETKNENRDRSDGSPSEVSEDLDIDQITVAGAASAEGRVK